MKRLNIWIKYIDVKKYFITLQKVILIGKLKCKCKTTASVFYSKQRIFRVLKYKSPY